MSSVAQINEEFTKILNVLKLIIKELKLKKDVEEKCVKGIVNLKLQILDYGCFFGLKEINIKRNIKLNETVFEEACKETFKDFLEESIIEGNCKVECAPVEYKMELENYVLKKKVLSQIADLNKIIKKVEEEIKVFYDIAFEDTASSPLKKKVEEVLREENEGEESSHQELKRKLWKKLKKRKKRENLLQLLELCFV